jgi:hypothetical protein
MTQPFVTVTAVWQAVIQRETATGDGLSVVEEATYRALIEDIARIDEILGEDDNAIAEISRAEFETAFLHDTVFVNGEEISRVSNAELFLDPQPILGTVANPDDLWESKACHTWLRRYAQWCQVGDIVRHLLGYRNEFGMDVAFETAALRIRRHGQRAPAETVAVPGHVATDRGDGIAAPGARPSPADLLAGMAEPDGVIGSEDIVRDAAGMPVGFTPHGQQILADRGENPQRRLQALQRVYRLMNED